MIRERIYNLVKRADSNRPISHAYDYFIAAVSLLSVTPLMFKESNPVLNFIDVVTVYILFADYILRWIVYDYTIKRHTVKAFILYPFMPFHLINLIALLPSMGLARHEFKILRTVRVFVAFSYSKSFVLVFNAFRKEWRAFCAVLVIAVTYIFISALALFSHEPDTFNSFFDALYWATTALTTVGYGDIYPVTPIGKLISMVSSFFGVAVVALPAGIITASFVEEINRLKDREQKYKSEKTSVLNRVLRDKPHKDDK